MATRPLNELSAGEVARGVADGAFTAEAVAAACLERIEAREPAVHAWIHLDRERALEEARMRDREAARGPLHGVPFGVKDIIDTADMPTAMGSPIYDGNRPRADAACVALVRAAGAVVLGKTVTCEFAGQAPGATTNPRDPARTPGGSSSGSAAAVADFMAAAAFGTQTGGSVLRPSSYCGIFGFKPSFGAFNLGGVKPAAESLDTLGLHARTLEDIALVEAVLVNRPPAPPRAPGRPPVIGLCRTPLWQEARPESVEAIEDSAARLAAAGATLRELELPDAFGGLTAARDTFNAYERARLMAWEWAHHRDLMSDRLRETIGQGLAMDYDEYLDAKKLAEDCRVRLTGLLDGLDAVLAPCVDGEAPVGLDSTGSPRFQGIWTLLHVPSLTLPTHAGPNRLPVGIQLVGRRHDDRRLLDVAQWVWNRLGPAPA